MTPIQPLEAYCDKVNLGSYRNLHILPIGNVDRSQYVEHLSDELTANFNIPIMEGAEWIAVPLIPTRQKLLQETIRNTTNGPIFNQRITGTYPGNSPELRDIFAKMIRDRYLVRFQDHDDYLYIIGSLENPATLSASFNTSPQKSGLKAWQISLTCQSEHPAPHYIGDLAASDFIV